MKGTFFTGADQPQKFEVRDMSFAPLQPHEVLVKNMSAGICGTDVHIYHGEKGSAEVKPPVVLGHEYAGIVVETGAAVTEVQAGDHVTVDPNIYCGKCRPCKMGKKQNCEHLFALGVNVNGGFAEYSVVPDTQCFLLKKEIPFDVGAMAEPLACAIHGVDLCDIQQGQSVLVIGGGPIGLLVVQLARLKGASPVILSEPMEMRRHIGLSVGADAVIDPLHENVAETVRSLTGEDGADVVIECVGRPFAAEQAVEAAGPGAMIMLFSVPAVDATIPLPLFEMYRKELTVRGSRINPDTHQRAVNLINAQRLEIEKLITHTYDLYHLEDAIHMQMSSESIKVVVHPHG
ncbi:zinc-dependent alcohol dehydrogenase family protein [Marvinbryantia formatexigens]|nr:zinc-dependent alcohol dehydrogenase family protein [Marvinbryantia formatexigens]UWO24848.1 zinc-dependent alcohol dehydrogenase family protein [Marvinbryantia formatexigens DSM 14469]SDG79109.1 2-desacetyl-2-hydroxyethyl bacteriochlorophyllide A dehydrogenase [Marvinbryantia formatexigens]